MNRLNLAIATVQLVMAFVAIYFGNYLFSMLCLVMLDLTLIGSAVQRIEAKLDANTRGDQP